MKPPKFDATYESDAMHRLGQGRQLHRTSKLRAANSIDRRPRFIGARRRSLRFRSGTKYALLRFDSFGRCVGAAKSLISKTPWCYSRGYEPRGRGFESCQPHQFS